VERAAVPSRRGLLLGPLEGAWWHGNRCLILMQRILIVGPSESPDPSSFSTSVWKAASLRRLLAPSRALA
jgi:hypothetical protein